MTSTPLHFLGKSRLVVAVFLFRDERLVSILSILTIVGSESRNNSLIFNGNRLIDPFKQILRHSGGTLLC